MPNYQGNPLGGIKLSGLEQQIAAGLYRTLFGGGSSSGGIGGANMDSAGMGNTGMGLGTLLSNGAGGNVPLLSSAVANPVLSSLAFAGNPFATLMSGGTGNVSDPSALLTSAMGSAGGASDSTPPAPNPQAKIEEAAVEALSDPNFALMLLRSNPRILQDVVKLLSTAGASGGGAVG